MSHARYGRVFAGRFVFYYNSYYDAVGSIVFKLIWDILNHYVHDRSFGGMVRG
jgi:hypothetical protein